MLSSSSLPVAISLWANRIRPYILSLTHLSNLFIHTDRDTSGSRSNRFQRQSNETNSSPKNVRQNRLPQKKNNVSYTQKWRDPEAWKGDLPRFAGTG